MEGLTVHESWTWTVGARYLSDAGKRLTEARYGFGDPFVAETVKMVYAATTQKLAATEHNPRYHRWRPDWRDTIMGAVRTAMLATVQSLLTRGEMALVVDRDTLVVASDATTPEQAWPGDPAKLGGASGQWKPAGVVDLAGWGPTRGRARRQIVAVHPAHGAPEQPAGLLRQGCRRRAGG